MFLGIDLISLLSSVGYIGIFIIIFLESGVLIGVVLPGDSLLFTAGLLASQGYFHLSWLIILCFVAAVLGDNFGYSFGRKLGPKVFSREDSWLFQKENLVRTEHFYQKYGAKVLILARFIPVIRCLAPIMAGVGKMRYRIFILNNIIGALLWSIGITLLGYWLGSTVKDIERYILPIIALIVIVSVIPPVSELVKAWQKKRRSQK